MGCADAELPRAWREAGTCYAWRSILIHQRPQVGPLSLAIMLIPWVGGQTCPAELW